MSFKGATSSVGKRKKNGLLSKKNTKGSILKQKGTTMIWLRMERIKPVGNDDFEKFCQFLQNTRTMRYSSIH